MTFAATARTARTADLVEEWGIDLSGTVTMADVAKAREELEYHDAHMWEWVSAWEEAEGDAMCIGAGTHVVDFLMKTREALADRLATLEERVECWAVWA